MHPKSIQKRPKSRPNEARTKVLNIWYLLYGIHFRRHWHEPETIFLPNAHQSHTFSVFLSIFNEIDPKTASKMTTPFSRKLHKTRLCHQKGPPGFQKSPKYTPKPSKVGTKALQIEVLSLKIDRWKRTIVCLFSYWRNDDMQDLESKKWSEECKRLSEKKLARANHVGGTVAATPRSGTG